MPLSEFFHSEESLHDFLNPSFEKLYPPGKQTEPTEKVREFASAFEDLSYPDGFYTIYLAILSRFHILPYSEKSEIHFKSERDRRWKLTADGLLTTNTIWDGKYCNDLVTLYVATTNALGFYSLVAKAFKKKEDGTIGVHSLPIVDDTAFPTRYVVNAGSKNYWVEELQRSQILTLGTSLSHSWLLWKAAPDQWSMGLFDPYQEGRTIVADAENYFNLED
jgi:hypothetical protein